MQKNLNIEKITFKVVQMKFLSTCFLSNDAENSALHHMNKLHLNIY